MPLNVGGASLPLVAVKLDQKSSSIGKDDELLLLMNGDAKLFSAGVDCNEFTLDAEANGEL